MGNSNNENHCSESISALKDRVLTTQSPRRDFQTARYRPKGRGIKPPTLTRNKKNDSDEKNIDLAKESEVSNNDFFINEVKLKPEFESRYIELIGEETFKCFKEFTNKYIRKSIRVNTLKISIDDLKKRLEKDWVLEQVPWCKEGFWITYRHGKRYDVGNLPEHQLGYIYVQDAASMIPPIVLSPKEDSFVLDSCAAPGSKTSQLAQYMNNTGLLIANDSQGKRLSALGINLQRCGVHNAIITKMDGSRIPNQSRLFDYVLVDAPCSGTGTIRRNFKIAEMWSPSLVKRMSRDQFRLASRAFMLLKEGGTMVYSTCTLEPEENEGIVDALLKKFPEADVLDINLDIKRSSAITSFNGVEYDSRVSKCLRIYPQDNDSEGFFVAKLTKKLGNDK